MDTDRGPVARLLFGVWFAVAHALLQRVRGRRLDLGLAAWSGALFVVVSAAFDHLRGPRMPQHIAQIPVGKAFVTGPPETRAAMESFANDLPRVLERAREEAAELGTSWIGTEHILLALVSESGGEAADVLRELGASRERVRAVVELVGGRRPHDREGEGLTPSAKRAVERAVTEARSRQSRQVGVISLLLGLVSDDQSTAMHVLRSLDLSAAQIRQAAERRS
jgi:hypothetical protein